MKMVWSFNSGNRKKSPGDNSKNFGGWSSCSFPFWSEKSLYFLCVSLCKSLIPFISDFGPLIFDISIPVFQIIFHAYNRFCKSSVLFDSPLSIHTTKNAKRTFIVVYKSLCNCMLHVFSYLLWIYLDLKK